MCTAATIKTKDFYFGRTLDNPFSYGEEIVISPKNFDFSFNSPPVFGNFFAIIGMAHIENGYPLYYDAINEKGLCIAGLNFVGNAFYPKPEKGQNNIAVYELIPYILKQCQSVKQVKELLESINLCDIPFSESLPTASLHWLIADKNEAITVESVKDGLKVYENPIGILTNNPPFEIQMFNLNNFMQLSSNTPKNTFSKAVELSAYSHGMGALGLPGDLSSQSRFVRAAFTKLNSVCEGDEKSSVSQFFHILGSVNQTRGCCDTGDGKYEITLYTSCCNADKGIYYYSTYGNRQITAVDMNKADLDSDKITSYPLITEQQINYI
ncbi:MAG: choloylglycine hydrolase [Clostridia bacterium]|nr:choloylglycine hydrolase [Clostridia bacterium]